VRHTKQTSVAGRPIPKLGRGRDTRRGRLPGRDHGAGHCVAGGGQPSAVRRALQDGCDAATRGRPGPTGEDRSGPRSAGTTEVMMASINQTSSTPAHAGRGAASEEPDRPGVLRLSANRLSRPRARRRAADATRDRPARRRVTALGAVRRDTRADTPRAVIAEELRTQSAQIARIDSAISFPDDRPDARRMLCTGRRRAVPTMTCVRSATAPVIVCRRVMSGRNPLGVTTRPDPRVSSGGATGPSSEGGGRPPSIVERGGHCEARGSNHGPDRWDSLVPVDRLVVDATGLSGPAVSSDVCRGL
jgi:hypothetical protein